MDYVYVKQLITFKKMCGEGVCMCDGGRGGGGEAGSGVNLQTVVVCVPAL